jgi:hypothetical protein
MEAPREPPELVRLRAEIAHNLRQRRRSQTLHFLTRVSMTGASWLRSSQEPGGSGSASQIFHGKTEREQQRRCEHHQI